MKDPARGSRLLEYSGGCRAFNNQNSSPKGRVIHEARSMGVKSLKSDFGTMLLPGNFPCPESWSWRTRASPSLQVQPLTWAQNLPALTWDEQILMNASSLPPCQWPTSPSCRPQLLPSLSEDSGTLNHGRTFPSLSLSLFMSRGLTMDCQLQRARQVCLSHTPSLSPGEWKSHSRCSRSIAE